MSAAKPAAGPTKGGGKKKLVLVAAAVLLLGGGGAGAWFSGVLPKLLGRGGDDTAEAHGAVAEKHAEKGEKHAEKGEKPGEKGDKHAEKGGVAPVHTEKHGDAKPDGHAAKGDPSFMDLPDIVANLNTGQRRAAYVKLKAKLELSRPEDQATIQAAMPRVLDLFQGYLREMRPEELRGTAGTYRLREELLARTNLAAPPARVVAVLFTEMIVQ